MRSRRPGKPGPSPMVLRGFTYKPPTGPDDVGEVAWGPKSPAGRFLSALPAGSDLAAQFARIHPATVRNWNARGEALLTAADCDGDLDVFAADNADRESVAYVAFLLAYRQAEVSPVVLAVDTIHRASAGGDVRAAEVILKRHPRAKSFRPDPRLELTGAGGGPIEVSDRDGAKAALAAAAARLADAVEAKVGEQPEPEERTHDGPDVPPVT